MDQSYREEDYIEPNIRSLFPKVRSVLGWDGLPREVVSPPAPGVCKQSPSLAAGKGKLGVR